MNKNILWPSIRFKEFTNAWEQEKLGDICKFKNGKAHEQYVQKNGKYIIINSKFISSNKEIIKRSNICLTPLFKDEIVMVLSDIPNGKALAKTVIIEENNKFTLNQRIGSFKVSGIHNAKFINLILNRNKYFLSFDDKVNQTNLSNSIILGCKVLVTSLHEENNISKLFLHLNNLITLHQRKLKALENIKMTLLDKMFPDEKSNIPSIRFEEFTNAWEQEKLGEISQSYKSFIKINDIDKSGKYNLYGVNGYIGKTVFPPKFNDKSSILIVKDGSVGKKLILPPNSNFTSTIEGIYPNSNYLTEFLFHSIKVEKLLKFSIGSTIKHLYFSEYGNMNIFVTNLKEQEKISKLLDSLNNLITLHQRKIKKIENIKKTLLEKMFP